MSISAHHSPSENPSAAGDLRNRVAGQSLFAVLARLQASGEFGIDLVARRIHVSPAAAPWHLGLLGERRIGGLLAQLGPGTTVLHSVPVGSKSSDIDHVVISESGIFTINAKNHPGQPVWVGGRGMMVGGSKVHHLGNAVHEAKRAERLLSAATGLTVPVTAVIVLVGVRQFTVRQPPIGDGVDISVVLDENLLPLLSGRPVFSPEQVRRIADAAVLPRTWSITAPREPGVAEVIAAYEAFETLPPILATAPSVYQGRRLLRPVFVALLALAAAAAGATTLLLGSMVLVALLGFR